MLLQQVPELQHGGGIRRGLSRQINPDKGPQRLAVGDRIFHAHIKDSRIQLNGRNSILSSHLDFGDHRRGWDFVSPGHGDVKWDPIIRALNSVGYQGPLSIEWEDSGMDREFGAQEALAVVRANDFAASNVAFDAAFAE